MLNPYPDMFDRANSHTPSENNQPKATHGNNPKLKHKHTPTQNTKTEWFELHVKRRWGVSCVPTHLFLVTLQSYRCHSLVKVEPRVNPTERHVNSRAFGVQTLMLITPCQIFNQTGVNVRATQTRELVVSTWCLLHSSASNTLKGSKVIKLEKTHCLCVWWWGKYGAQKETAAEISTQRFWNKNGNNEALSSFNTCKEC